MEEGGTSRRRLPLGPSALLSLLIVLILASLLPIGNAQPPLRMKVSPDGAEYLLEVYGRVWLTSRTPRLFCDGQMHAVRDDTALPLVFKSARIVKGEEKHFGPFEAHVFEWEAKEWTDAPGGTPFIMTFKVFQSGRAIIFEQSFPEGAKATALNSTRTNNNDKNDKRRNSPQRGIKSTPWHYLDSETRVLSEFPSFAYYDDTVIGELGYLFWSGQTLTSYWGQGFHNVSGIETGPVALFDEQYHTIVISALNNFKVGMLSTNTSNPWGPTISAGLSGRLTSLPRGFVHQTLIFAGDGITQTLHDWGSALQQYYGTKHYPEQDIFLNYLSYWTDNGAYYYFGVWENMTQDGTPQDIFLELKQTLDAQNLPIAAVQMDAWWYTMGNPDACIVEWKPVPELFPKGFNWLSDQLGVPFSLYSHIFCVDNVYLNRYPFITSVNYTVPWGHGVFTSVAPESSYTFYTKLMEYGFINGAMSNFRVDYLDFIFLCEDDFQDYPSTYFHWLKGMADAAALINQTPIELSMPIPSDILSTLLLPMIDMTRVSDDYAHPTNWNIGTSSILPWVLGVRPNKDTFWSTTVQDGNPYNRTEPSPELHTIEAIFSCGPVGLGDKIGYTNATLIRRTIDANGRLLQPSKPLTSIDSMFTTNRRTKVPDGGQVWGSYSSVPNSDNNSTRPQSYWFYLLAVDLPASYQVRERDFWPHSKMHQDYVYRKDAPLTSCTAGLPARDCISYVRDEGYPVLTTGLDPSMHVFGLWTFFPRNGDDWILLGELDKFVALSPQRFRSIDIQHTKIVAELTGAANEVVRLWAVDTQLDVILYQEVVLSSKGTATAVFI